MPKPVYSKKKTTKNYARVFESFGVSFGKANGSAEVIADECPWCGGPKFYLNTETGLYDCKTGDCQESGNISTYLTWFHGECLAATTEDHYRALKKKRGGIAIQTLERHELALNPLDGSWLIPFKNRKGSVVNPQRYNPANGKKYNLPELATCLYGFDKLTNDKKRIVYLCEGPFDAIALDYALNVARGLD